MIFHSKNLLRAMATTIFVFLIMSLGLGVSYVVAKELDSEGGVNQSEIKEQDIQEFKERENSSFRSISWRKERGYLEIPVDLNDLNFNVVVEGKELSDVNYSLSEKKNVLFLHSEYLENLSLGTYNIVIKDLDRNKALREIAVTIEIEEGQKANTEGQTESKINTESETKTESSKTSKEISSDGTTGLDSEKSINTSSSFNSNLGEITETSLISKTSLTTSILNKDEEKVLSKSFVNPVRPDIKNSQDKLYSDLKKNSSTTNAYYTNTERNKKTTSRVASTGVVSLAGFSSSGFIFTISVVLISLKRNLGEKQDSNIDESTSEKALNNN